MILHEPFIITSRLLAGLKVGDSTISIAYGATTSEGRVVYHYYIDTPDWEYDASDIKSGCQGGNLLEGMSSLLSFLSAASEAYQYGGDNDDLFPPHVMEWCYMHSDELSMLSLEIEETETILIEEEK